MANKIKFKQKKYMLPLIILPFILFIVYSFSGMVNTEKEEVVEVNDEIKLGLGEDITKGEIKRKEDAYRDFYNLRGQDSRSEVQNIVDEEKDDNTLGSNYTEKQQRTIDSLDEIRSKQKKELDELKKKKEDQQRNRNEQRARQDQEDKELLKLLADQSKKKEVKPKTDYKDLEKIQMRTMRKQMALMDSIEEVNSPEARERRAKELKLKEDKEKYEKYLEGKIPVTTSIEKSDFNTVYKEQDNQFIKAVIDENIKGYLGSRIRIRLLETIYVGERKIEKGSYLYSQITGFTLQRVELSIVSVMTGNEIYPIKLDIYDNDGMKGLYVPKSLFRQMTNDAGGRTVQGADMNTQNDDFYTTALSQVFQSSSRALSQLIRKNKAKIKYNTFVYLVDESN
jgi:conjugative transposon TraM protein